MHHFSKKKQWDYLSLLWYCLRLWTICLMLIWWLRTYYGGACFVSWQNHNPCTEVSKTCINNICAPIIFVLIHSSGLYSAIWTCFICGCMDYIINSPLKSSDEVFVYPTYISYKNLSCEELFSWKSAPFEIVLLISWKIPASLSYGGPNCS